MKVVYFDSIPSEQESLTINSQLNGDEKVAYLTSPDNDISSLQVKAEYYTLDESLKKKINYEILNKIQHFQENNIKAKKVNSLFTINGLNCWHYVKFRVYFRVRNLFYKKTIIEELSDKYESVLFVTKDNVIKNYNDINGVNVYHLTEQKKSKLNWPIITSYTLFLFIRYIIFFLKIAPIKKHLLLDTSLPSSYIGLNLKKKKGNYIIAYLIEQFHNSFTIINERELPKFNQKGKFKVALKDIFLHRNVFPGEGITIAGILRKSVRENASEDYLSLTSNIQELSGMPLLIDQIIIDSVKESLPSVKVFLLRHHAYKRFFSKHKRIISISGSDENSPMIKSVLDAAKILNIKTVGIQHGAIHPLHPAYMYSPSDAKDKTMSDITMLWGETTKQILAEKGNYPEQSLINIGQIRTDIIPILKRADKQDLVPKQLLNKQIIMFASQPQRDSLLRYKAAEDVVNACKDISNTILVIKLHPAERNDVAYYKNIAQKNNCSNYFIDLGTDLYTLISISDIVITCFSTVGAEVVYFQKPLIILDHLKQDLQNYCKLGIALQATNQRELKGFIEKIFLSEIEISKEAYDKFIKSYSTAIDGKVCSRFNNFLETIEA